MKKLTILLFSILISLNSYGEWIKFYEDDSGNTFYMDKDTIKEHNGYVYWWRMNDRLKPDKYGDMSVKSYVQGDCGVNRLKVISIIYYKQPIGRGSGETDNTPGEWMYPSPDSISGGMFKYVCDYVD